MYHDEHDTDDEPTFPGASTYQRARVLVVEDDPRFRALVAHRLKRDGYDVYATGNASDALTTLHYINALGFPTDRFELVILDHHLPGQSGLDVLRHLRRLRDRTPVLLMTAFPETEVLDEANRHGATLLLKPFNLDLLSDAAITTILAHRGGEHR